MVENPFSPWGDPGEVANTRGTKPEDLVATTLEYPYRQYAELYQALFKLGYRIPDVDEMLIWQVAVALGRDRPKNLRVGYSSAADMPPVLNLLAHPTPEGIAAALAAQMALIEGSVPAGQSS